MDRWISLIRSPRHLFVFEAAARCGSFSAAAREMDISQPAISQCIRQLEATLGTALFVRGHRRNSLTTAGERLYTVVSSTLTQIQRTAESIRNEYREHPVTLSSSSAFAHYWVVPRLAALHAKAPAIELRVQVTDRDVELEADGRSLGIRRGSGHWPGYAARPIAPERLLAVASAAYIARAGRPRYVDEIARHQLIHLEEPIRPRPVWADWFHGLASDAVPPADGLRFNDYALVLQAAMAGEGIALGWHHIVDRLISQGLLEPVLEEHWLSGAQFYLIWNQRAELSSAACQVRDWVIAEAKTVVPLQ